MAILTGKFVSGNCINVKRISDNVFSCSPNVEERYLKQGNTNQWFLWSAKIEDGKDQKVTIFLNWPEFDRKKMMPGIQYGSSGSFIGVVRDVVYLSYDRLNWDRIDDVEVDGYTVKISLSLKEDTAYLSVNLPYMPPALKALYQRIKTSKWVKITDIGYTYEGRKLQVISVTDSSVPISQKKTVYLQAAQHPAERIGCHVIDEMARYLISDNPEAEKIRQKFIFHMVPVVTIDGIYNCTQGHPSGVNLNRDWVNFSQPETSAIKGFIENIVNSGEKIVLAADLHNGWIDSKANGAAITIFLPEEVGENYADKQVQFIDNICEKCDYLQPGKYWRKQWLKGEANSFKTYMYQEYGYQAHTFEFSRYNIWDRNLKDHIHLTQDRVKKAAVQILKAITSFYCNEVNT